MLKTLQIRKILPPLIGIVLISSCTCNITITTPPESFSETIVCTGNKSELYDRANEWFINTFQNSESFIEFSDMQEGRIIGKYLLNSNARTTYGQNIGENIYALINVYMEDGAANISIKPQNPWHYDPSGFRTYNSSLEDNKAEILDLITGYPSRSTIYNYSREDAKADIMDLILSFKAHMTIDDDVW